MGRQLHSRCPVEEPLSMLLVSDPALELATLPTNSNAMAVLSVATFQLLVLPKAASGSHLLKIEWARTPPSASWRFDTGRERERAPAGRRTSPRRGGRSPSPRRGRGDYSPRKDDRRDRDYERRDRDRSRSPEDRDRDVKDERDREEGRENGTNGDDRKVTLESPPQTHDELDTAE